MEDDLKDLDEPLILLKPAHWLALGGCLVILLGVIGAAVFGSIPIQVKGKGLFFNPSQIFSINSSQEGVVTRVDVHWGSSVKKGDPVVELSPHLDISSEGDGTVFAIDVNGGSKVSIGEPLLWLQKETKEPLQMTGIIPMKAAEHVQVGMPVEITVLNADPVEYGRALGKVSQLIPFWTQRSRDLFPTRYLSIPEGPEQFTHLIVVELNKNPDTASGFEWTSGNGPPFEIKVGTPCRFRVITERKSPLSYLFE